MITNDIQTLINYAADRELISRGDEIYVRNRLMQLLKLDMWDSPQGESGLSVDTILDRIVGYAAENGIIPDSAAYRDIFDTEIMGVLTAFPHEVNAKFAEKYARSPREATDWYYAFSKDTNYVRAGRIARDIRWRYESEYGTLDITINRSKPEKDPRDIAAAKSAPKAGYPACQLCIENTGFHGTLNHPARQNLRPVPITVGGQAWSFQYSPYGYYNEHCIVFNNEHVPMKIDAAVFGKLFDVLDFAPHYFIGSNADLPVVGGSILSHEHFQGGHYTFAMAEAQPEQVFGMENFPDVYACTIKWPMSVIRLRSADKDRLSAACDAVLRAWRGYSDESAEILAETDAPHNTITPIARMRDGGYECDLVLRNNRATAEHPLGIFHPHAELHHIKKENIGLIEVMGLAVLPARLAEEIDALADALVSGADISADGKLACHAEWLAEVRTRFPAVKATDAKDIIMHEIGAVFEKVLLDAGVFKRTPDGAAAFSRFIALVSRQQMTHVKK